MNVTASTTINAPTETVWAVLTDPARLTQDTGILRLDGRIAPGAKIKLWSSVAPDRAFKLRVTAFEPARAMVWEGGMPLGLFRGTRRFTLTPEGAQIQLMMSETFTGPLAGPITRTMPDLQPSFETFLAAVKRMSEGDTQ
ncbi:MAG: SRPBCC domain-containing protein [Pseudomonadota bacterium]